MVSIDIDEKTYYEKNPRLVELLLFDNTTKKNIIWATDLYLKKGYKFNDCISEYNLLNKKLITPRSKKAKTAQIKRSKDNGEVFTPSWICNIQNNNIDEVWFGKKDLVSIKM